VAQAAASVALAQSAARAPASAEAAATASPPPPPRRLPASALAADGRDGAVTLGLAEAVAPGPPPHAAAPPPPPGGAYAAALTSGTLPTAPAGAIGAVGGLGSAARPRSMSLVARFAPYAAPPLPGAPPGAKSAAVAAPPHSAARPSPTVGVDAAAIRQPGVSPAEEVLRHGVAAGAPPPAHASFAVPEPAASAVVAPAQHAAHPAASPLAASQPLQRATAAGGPAPSRLTPPKPASAAAHPAAAFSLQAAAAGTLSGFPPPFAAYGTTAASHLSPPATSMGLAPSVSGVSAIGTAAPLWPPPAPPVAPELLAHLRSYSGQPNAPAAQATFDWLVSAHAAPGLCWEQVLTSARVLLAAASWAGVPSERLFGASEAELSQVLRAYVTRVVVGSKAVDAAAAGAAAAEAGHAAAGAAAKRATGAFDNSEGDAGGGLSSSGAGDASGCAWPHLASAPAPASLSSDICASRAAPAAETAGGVGGDFSDNSGAAALAAVVQSRGAAAPQASGCAAGFRTPAATVPAEGRSERAAPLAPAAAAGGTLLFAASANASVVSTDLGSSQTDGAVVGRKRSRRAAAAAAGANSNSTEGTSVPASDGGASGDSAAQLSGISLSVAIGSVPDSSSSSGAGAPQRQGRGRQRRAPERYSDSSFAARRRSSGSTTCSTATSPAGSTFRAPQQDWLSLGSFGREAAVREVFATYRQQHSAHAAACAAVGGAAAGGGASNSEDARSPASSPRYHRLRLRSTRLTRNAPSAASPTGGNGGDGRGALSSFLSLSVPAGAGGEGAGSGPSKRRRTSSTSRGATRQTGDS
jgi:hypothetical protein